MKNKHEINRELRTEIAVLRNRLAERDATIAGLLSEAQCDALELIARLKEQRAPHSDVCAVRIKDLDAIESTLTERDATIDELNAKCAVERDYGYSQGYSDARQDCE